MAANERTALVGDKDGVTFKKNKCFIFANVKAVTLTFSVILVVVICAFTVAYINLKNKEGDVLDLSPDGKALEEDGEIGRACINRNKHCVYWAKRGECSRSSIYMNKFCAYSCGRCRVGVCVDKNKNCAYWKKTGYCRKSPAYMKKNCAFSCGTCGGKKKKKGTKGGKKKKKKITGKDNRKYRNECKKWAASGDCKKTPTRTWMTKNCKRSCQTVKKRRRKRLNLNDRYCGLKLNIGRIVGGKQTKIGDWPWQVGIVKKKDTTAVFCGGTLINSRTVLTASHCFTGGNKKIASLYAVRVGEANLKVKEVGEEIVNVKKLVTYEDFSLRNYNNDIAILILEEDVTDQRFVGEVCIPNARQEPVAGKVCFITGWGRLKEGGILPPVMQVTKVPIVNHKLCEKAYSDIIPVTNNMFCAGSNKGTIDACQGDSGGPLVCKYTDGRYYLQGITSWGLGCARKGRYGVYTNVINYDKWIDNILKQEK